MKKNILNNKNFTSAHCTINKIPAAVIAVVGSVSRTTGGTDLPLMKFTNHPKFNVNNGNFEFKTESNNLFNFQSTDLRNDISMIKTLTPIILSATVQPIRLSSDSVAVGTNAIVSGYLI